MSAWMFLLDLVFGVWVGACLLRFWLNRVRISMAQQPGPFILAITDRLVLPLRRLLPARWQRSGWDVASLLAAVLLALVQAVLWQGLLLWSAPGHGAGVPFDVVITAWLALRWLLLTGLRLLMYLVLAHAVLSWVQPNAPVQGWLSRLLAPWLNPLRRLIPLVGGVDLSALVLLVLIQVAIMWVG